jgi:hypothetical protein
MLFTTIIPAFVATSGFNVKHAQRNATVLSKMFIKRQTQKSPTDPTTILRTIEIGIVLRNHYSDAPRPQASTNQPKYRHIKITRLFRVRTTCPL